MPRETIRSRHNATEPTTADDPTPLVGLGVTIGWSKSDRGDGTVELSAVNIPAVHTSREGGPVIPLDRHALNNLIRTLRKARDGAFGADA